MKLLRWSNFCEIRDRVEIAKLRQREKEIHERFSKNATGLARMPFCNRKIKTSQTCPYSERTKNTAKMSRFAVGKISANDIIASIDLFACVIWTNTGRRIHEWPGTFLKYEELFGYKKEKDAWIRVMSSFSSSYFDVSMC